MATFDIGYAELRLFDSLPFGKHVVDFEGQNDSTYPQNWPAKEKLAISMVLLLYSLTAMSAHAASWTALERLNDINLTSGTIIPVFGSVCGTLLCTQLSDLYGRRIAIISATLGFGVSSVVVAIPINPQTLAVARYFVATFGCAPLTLVPAVFADMFSGHLRGFNVACHTMLMILSSFAGYYLAESSLRRARFALLAGLVSFFICTLAIIFKKESHSPIVLIFKAAELRRQTHDWRIHVRQARYGRDSETLPSQDICLAFRMLFHEPLIMLATTTMS
nr:putative transporter [Quercus suber]